LELIGLSISKYTISWAGLGYIFTKFDKAGDTVEVVVSEGSRTISKGVIPTHPPSPSDTVKEKLSVSVSACSFL